MTARAVPMARHETDWVGIFFAVVLTLVIIFPLIVVATWSVANVWRYPAVIPQEFGLRYWHMTLARADMWTSITTSITLSLVVTALSALICLPAAYAFARMEFRRAASSSSPSSPGRPSRNSDCSSPLPASSCNCS